MTGYMIDIGCGSCKKNGYVGIDILEQSGVDYVLDMRTEPLPFPDKSVEAVFSSHFLEHIGDPTNIFAEIGRVARDGAKLELWTPYTWANSAFIIDHKLFINEDHYLHICNWYVDFWKNIVKSRWLLKELQYVIEEEALVDLYKEGISLDFALKYYKGIVKEFCAHIEVRHNYDGPVVEPQKTFSLDRNSDRHFIKPDKKGFSSENGIKKAIRFFSGGNVA